MKYDVILKNNSTGKYEVISKLRDNSPTELYLQFDDVDLSNLPDGEYTYCVVKNDEFTTIEYELVPDTLNSRAIVNGRVSTLKQLNPFIGIMKIGETKVDFPAPAYNNDEDTYYYEG